MAARPGVPPRALLLLAAPLVLAACGKRGDPLPPLRRNPEPVESLELVQRGDRVELSWVTPTRTVDGARLGVLDVEVWRATGPGDLLRVGTRTVTRGAPGERLTHEEPLPDPGVALRYAVRTVNEGRESALSPEAVLTVRPPPPPPSDMAAALDGDAIALSWTECVPTTPEPTPAADPPDPGSRVPGAAPPTSPAAGSPTPATPPLAAVPGSAPDAPPPAAAGSPTPTPTPTPAPPASVGVRLYRRGEEGRYAEPLEAAPLTGEAYRDADVGHQERYCYVSHTVLSGQPVVEGSASEEVCVTFLDRVPPPTPRGLALLPREAGVELSWSRAPAEGEAVAHYRVYRSVDEGPPERIAELPPEATRYTDGAAPMEAIVDYTLTAVDAAGNESPPTPAARLTPR